jgi:hypothetical protein
MNTPNTLTLVLGVDASGKSTFLHGVQDTLGYHVLEPTSTVEARSFKSVYGDRPLSPTIVDKRQQLFRSLNDAFDHTIALERVDNNVATTGSRLVTDISHAVMRRIMIDEPVSVTQIIDQWHDSTSSIPDHIVLMHAPMDTIKQRIIDRQLAGVMGEKLLGFNSLYFLDHYQDTLQDTLNELSYDYSTVQFDSSVLPPQQIIDAYAHRTQ